MVKPKIRKTKEELIMENEMHYQLHRHKPQLGRLGTGVSGNTVKPPRAVMSMDKARAPNKPTLTVDLTKQLQGVKRNQFEDIPDDHSNMPPKRPPLKPKTVKQLSHQRKEEEEKPITGKLTNTAPDGTYEERKIERLHNPKKEVTQKPNFGRFNSQGGENAPQQF